MNKPRSASEVKYNGSRDDIILHFNEHHQHHLFDYIGRKKNGEINVDKEIKEIMIQIGKKNKEIGFENYRKHNSRNLSYEDAGHLINTVLIYNKGVQKIKNEIIMNIMDNNCTLEIPSEIKSIKKENIEKHIVTQEEKETYMFLTKKIRDITAFFYNFREKYIQEQRERDLEDTDKDDIYKNKKESAFDIIYKQFFKSIDPENKFKHKNEKIIKIWFKIIEENKKKAHTHTEEDQNNEIIEREEPEIGFEDNDHIPFGEKIQIKKTAIPTKDDH